MILCPSLIKGMGGMPGGMGGGMPGGMGGMPGGMGGMPGGMGGMQDMMSKLMRCALALITFQKPVSRSVGNILEEMNAKPCDLIFLHFFFSLKQTLFYFRFSYFKLLKFDWLVETRRA